MRVGFRRSRPAPRHGDAGFTLVELVVSIVLIALVATVISTAVIVMFRSESGAIRVTSESHDTQQGVNYFPLDVHAGPTLAASYDTSPGAGGCVAEGTNVLQFDKGTQRVAYRLTVDGKTGRLDRHVCDLPIGGTSTLVSVNIADRLDASGGAAASATVFTDGSFVESIELHLSQDGTDALVVASPRSEPRNTPGDCQTGNPIEASRGYGVFIEGDVVLQSGEVTGWLGLGGTLTWFDNVTVASQNMSGVDPIYGLYAETVDWAGDEASPAEVLTVGTKGAALGGAFFQAGDLVYESNGSSENFIDLAGPSNPSAESTAGQISFATDFDELRDCSAQIARLLDICALEGCANEVEVTASLSVVKVCSSDSIPQVLNVPESYFDGSWTFDSGGAGGCQGFSQTRPLIINVIDGGDETVTIAATPVDWKNLGDRKNIIFNFPNASHVIIENGFYGQVLAPFAHVETYGNLEGGVVASRWTHHSGVVDSDADLFDGEIEWP